MLKRRIVFPGLILLLLIFSNLCAAANYPYLIFDSDGNPEFPKNFRSSKTPYPKTTSKTPSRLGLDTLNMSGSAQFTHSNFNNMIHALGIKAGYVIDLRQESHGFLDGTPVSWYGIKNGVNKNKTPEEIALLENSLIEALNMKKKVVVFKHIETGNKESFKPVLTSYQHASDEKTFVLNNGFNYARFYVLDHYPPTDAQIDEFVQFIKTLSQPSWLHFHCHAGHGRTTTFIVMYDMIRNAHHVSMSDIIQRQALIGGENLIDVTDDGTWRITINKNRLHIIEAFYQFVKDPKGYSAGTWSAWRANNS